MTQPTSLRKGASAALLLCLIVLFGAGAQAQVLFSEVEVIGDGAAPVRLSLQVPAEGDYRLSLGDQAFPMPDGFASLDGLLLDESGAVIGAVDLDNSLELNGLAAGTYELIVVGELNDGGAGLFTVELNEADGADVLTLFEAVVGPLQPVGAESFIRSVEVTEEGVYALRLSDFAFPDAFDDLRVLLIRQADNAVMASLDTAIDGLMAVADDLMLMEGAYDLAVFADPADANQLGALGLALAGGPLEQVLFDQAFAVSAPSSGAAFGITAFDVPADGTYTLTLADFAFPASLQSLGALLIEDSVALATLAMAGATDLEAQADTTYMLLTFAEPDPLAQSGTFGVNVSGGPFGETALDSVGTVESGDDDGATVDVDFGVPAAGDYELEVVDFGFPSPLNSLTVLLLRGPVLEQTLAEAGTFAFTAGAADAFTAVIVGDPDVDGGLVGIALRDATTGEVLLERNLALGAAFASRSFTVTGSETHAATVDDLVFPARFADLRAVVTRGAEVIGAILGAGTFEFDATPGTYTLSVLAQVDESATFGTFRNGVEVIAAAPPPDPAPEPTPDPEPDPGREEQQGGGGGSLLWLTLWALLGCYLRFTPRPGEATRAA